MTKRQIAVMSPVERASVSIRSVINNLIYTFLTRRGFAVERVKDRRGKEILLTGDEATARAAAVLLLNTDFTPTYEHTTNTITGRAI
jgi:hypothetical protein